MNILEMISSLITPLTSYISTVIAPLFINNEMTFITHTGLIALFAIGSVRLGRGALTAFVTSCWIMGNLFVIKEATIFGLQVVTSDGFAIGANIGINLLREYYGNRAAKNGIWIGFYTAVFFMVMCIIHLIYVPNAFDTTHVHFAALLGRMTRIVCASFIVSLLSKNLNLFLFDKIKNKLGDKHFALSSFLSLAVSQLVDTTLFALIALYGNVHSIFQIIIFSTIVKCIAIGISVPCVTFAKRFISKPEEEIQLPYE